MTNEFVFGPRDKVAHFARKRRWKPEGRASWLTPSGKCVHFLAFEEQRAAINKGERVYVVGKLSATASRHLRRIGAIAVG
jgi:hypothetical protein